MYRSTCTTVTTTSVLAGWWISNRRNAREKFRWPYWHTWLLQGRSFSRCQRKVSVVGEHLVSCSKRDVGFIPNQVIDTTRFQSPFSNCTSGRWGFVLFATAYRAECKLVRTVFTLFVYWRLWWSWIHKKDWASEECWLLLYWPKSRVSDRPWEFAGR